MPSSYQVSPRGQGSFSSGGTSSAGTTSTNPFPGPPSTVKPNSRQLPSIVAAATTTTTTTKPSSSAPFSNNSARKGSAPPQSSPTAPIASRGLPSFGNPNSYPNPPTHYFPSVPAAARKSQQEQRKTNQFVPDHAGRRRGSADDGYTSSRSGGASTVHGLQRSRSGHTSVGAKSDKTIGAESEGKAAESDKHEMEEEEVIQSGTIQPSTLPPSSPSAHEERRGSAVSGTFSISSKTSSMRDLPPLPHGSRMVSDAQASKSRGDDIVKAGKRGSRDWADARASPEAVQQPSTGVSQLSHGEHMPEHDHDMEEEHDGQEYDELEDGEGDDENDGTQNGDDDEDDGMEGIDGAPAKKRSRTLTTAHQTSVLNALLAKTRFPSTETREEVGRQIGMSSRRVQIWFQNRRQSQKRARDRETTDLPPLPIGSHHHAYAISVGGMAHGHPTAAQYPSYPQHPYMHPRAHDFSHSAHGPEPKAASGHPYTRYTFPSPSHPLPQTQAPVYAFGGALPQDMHAAGVPLPLQQQPYRSHPYGLNNVQAQPPQFLPYQQRSGSHSSLSQAQQQQVYQQQQQLQQRSTGRAPVLTRQMSGDSVTSFKSAKTSFSTNAGAERGGRPREEADRADYPPPIPGTMYVPLPRRRLSASIPTSRASGPYFSHLPARQNQGGSYSSHRSSVTSSNVESHAPFERPSSTVSSNSSHDGGATRRSGQRPRSGSYGESFHSGASGNPDEARLPPLSSMLGSPQKKRNLVGRQSSVTDYAGEKSLFGRSAGLPSLPGDRGSIGRVEDFSKLRISAASPPQHQDADVLDAAMDVMFRTTKPAPTRTTLPTFLRSNTTASFSSAGSGGSRGRSEADRALLAPILATHSSSSAASCTSSTSSTGTVRLPPLSSLSLDPKTSPLSSNPPALPVTVGRVALPALPGTYSSSRTSSLSTQSSSRRPRSSISSYDTDTHWAGHRGDRERDRSGHGYSGSHNNTSVSTGLGHGSSLGSLNGRGWSPSELSSRTSFSSEVQEEWDRIGGKMNQKGSSIVSILQAPVTSSIREDSSTMNTGA